MAWYRTGRSAAKDCGYKADINLRSLCNRRSISGRGDVSCYIGPFARVNAEYEGELPLSEGRRIVDVSTRVVWQEWPSGVLIDTWFDVAAGVQKSNVAVVAATYNDHWSTSLSAGDGGHPVVVAFVAEFPYYNDADGYQHTQFIISPGRSGYRAEGWPGFYRYHPEYNWDFSWNLDFELIIPTCEVMQPTINTLPTGDYDYSTFNADHLGLTEFEFGDRYDGPSDWVEPGFVANGQPGIMNASWYVYYHDPADPIWTRGMKAELGTHSHIIGYPHFRCSTFPGGVYNPDPSCAAGMGDDGIERTDFSPMFLWYHAGPPIKVASAKIGTVQEVLHLGYDANDLPVSYSGDEGDSDEADGEDRQWQVQAEDDTVEFWTNVGSAGRHEVDDLSLGYHNNGWGSPDRYVRAAWSLKSSAVRYRGQCRYMDGTPLPAETPPEWEDNLGNTWTGDASPEFVYSGNWSLEPYILGDYVSDTPGAWNTTVTDRAGGPLVWWWARNEGAPTEFSGKLTNPTDYGAEADDTRVLIQYPRRWEVLRVAVANVAIDGMDALDAAGDGGWAGDGLGTGGGVSIVGGNVQVVVGPDAENPRIYRADFLTTKKAGSPPVSTPFARFWPPHRFVSLACTMGAGEDFDAAIRVSGGGMTAKTFSHWYEDPAGEFRYDTCCPDGHADTDSEQSYMEQAQPDWPGSSGFIPRGDDADLSWSWGVGLFEQVEILLETDRTYTFSDLSTVMPADDDLYVEFPREYDSEIQLPTDTGGEEHYIHRMGLAAINGRYAWEAISCHKAVTSSWAVVVVDLATTGRVFWPELTEADPEAQFPWRWPEDDWDAFTFTDVIGHPASYWWDAVTSEYVDERALLANDACPIFWLDPTSGTLGNAALRDPTSGSVYGRPVCDVLKCTNWYGDGVTDQQVSARQIYFVKYLRGRAHGIVWQNDQTPDEVSPDDPTPHFPVGFVSADNTETADTDEVGYVRSEQHGDPVAVNYGGESLSCTPIDARNWFRFAHSLVLAPPSISRMRHGKYFDTGVLQPYRDVDLL